MQGKWANMLYRYTLLLTLILQKIHTHVHTRNQIQKKHEKKSNKRLNVGVRKRSNTEKYTQNFTHKFVSGSHAMNKHRRNHKVVEIMIRSVEWTQQYHIIYLKKKNRY